MVYSMMRRPVEQPVHSPVVGHGYLNGSSSASARILKGLVVDVHEFVELISDGGHVNIPVVDDKVFLEVIHARC